ncbi:TRAP transporter large permease [Marivibrio halodurans]|uniref:TRAP transporter large permease n=1 Tax=Marivibrio halodurans TaxID=2039722 RepID=UPI001FE78BCD|nr:TRAP transporter large permease [Marivibrio halodurans]
MEPVTLAIAVVCAVLILLVLRVPIAYALGVSASVGLILFFGWRPGGDPNLLAGLRPTLAMIGSSAYGFVHNYPMSMIPLFIGLGHVAYHAGITTDFYYALRVLLRRLPGGLAMASVNGCAGFSAITGSSVACAAAMGRIAVPEMLRYGYDPRLAAGSVAAGGTLGSLIPPSLLFVIYAIFTEQSVKGLFLAGIVPGLLSLIGFLVTILIWCRLRPQHAPQDDTAPTNAERIASLTGLWPAAILFLVVVGGIYLGIFTPTEAAAVSLVVAIVIGCVRRRLTLSLLAEAGRETVRQTTMIFLIALAAKVFTSFVSLTRITPTALEWLQQSDPSFLVVILAVVLFYLIIGMFLDSIGILVLTLPFTVPLMMAYDVNLIWFGVIVIKLLEVGLMTPPIGLNVFVIKGVSPPEVTLRKVFQGTAAFLLLDAVVLILILSIPALSLWLPNSAF